MFEKLLFAGWGDMDFNGHMRNTAYLDKSADVRMAYFSQAGFPMSEFARLRIGPVIKKDALEYFREVNLLDELRVTLQQAGMAADGSCFLLCNEFYRGERLAARVKSQGGWLDLDARKLTVPPPALLEALCALVRTGDFQELDSSIR
jgi:acyl-CoA thioester hydrolase